MLEVSTIIISAPGAMMMDGSVTVITVNLAPSFPARAMAWV